ncbi:MAG: FAD-dependent oxidoreductase, partial [Gammaproteobacteria bacterium]
MSGRHYDLIAVGGGSGGLAAAQRAAEYGARCAVIESHKLGGTCVNVGCVPKKVTWHAAGFPEAIRIAADYGFEASISPVIWDKLKEARDTYVLRLNGIYASNLEKR